MKAMTLAWGGKLRQRNTQLTAIERTRHASSSSVQPTDTALAAGANALSQSSMFGDDTSLVQTPSLENVVFSSSDSAEPLFVEPREAGEARRNSGRRSSRLSFYSLFSNRRQSSRTERQLFGNWSALDDMARRRDVLGYAKELVRSQKREEMLQVKATLQPMLTVLGIKTDQIEQGWSVLLQTNCTVKQVTMLSPFPNVCQLPPCTADELVVNVCLKGSPGRKAEACPSLLDAVGIVTIQSIRQHTTVPLLALTRRLVMSSRAAKKDWSFSSKSGIELEIPAEFQQHRSSPAQIAEAPIFFRGSISTESRPDTFTDVMQSLVEVMHETPVGDWQDDVQLQGRQDGDGSAGETLRGETLPAGAEVVIDIDQSSLRERMSLESDVPLVTSPTVSSLAGPVPLRPLASNPLASVSDRQSLLSAPRPSIDSVGFRQSPWGSSAPLSGLSSPLHDLSRTVDDETTTASTTSRSLRPPAIRGEGVGESFQNLDDLVIDEDGEKNWQDIAGSVKLTSLSESFSCISVTFVLQQLSIEVAVEDVSASLKFTDVQSALTMKQNKERDPRSDSDNTRVRVCETISFCGVVPSLRLTADDHLDIKLVQLLLPILCLSVGWPVSGLSSVNLSACPSAACSFRTM